MTFSILLFGLLVALLLGASFSTVGMSTFLAALELLVARLDCEKKLVNAGWLMFIRSSNIWNK